VCGWIRPPKSFEIHLKIYNFMTLFFKNIIFVHPKYCLCPPLNFAFVSFDPSFILKSRKIPQFNLFPQFDFNQNYLSLLQLSWVSTVCFHNLFPQFIHIIHLAVFVTIIDSAWAVGHHLSIFYLFIWKNFTLDLRFSY
jgi:hypothetical protein